MSIYSEHRLGYMDDREFDIAYQNERWLEQVRSAELEDEDEEDECE